jgi:phospholipase/carboxylesterase
VGEGVEALTQPRIPRLSEASSEYLFDYVSEAIGEVREHLNIHPGRVFLVGYGEGAAAAYRLGLGMPEHYAGIVAINGWLPRTHHPLIWLPQARRLRILITHGRENRLVPLSAAQRAMRQLLAAGMDCSLHTVDTGHRIHARVLRLIDNWLMEMCISRQEQPVRSV